MCHDLFKQFSIDELLDYSSLLLLQELLQQITLYIHDFAHVWIYL